jgi:fusaric acid resistance family protein
VRAARRLDGSPLRAAVRVERSRLARAGAVAGAVGYALPLAAGLATGHLRDGVAASVGALIVGFANLGGPRRVRAQAMLVTALAAGAGALAGGLAAPMAAVPLVGAWSFGAGLLVALGTRAAFAGILSTWALLLAGGLGLHGAGAVREAALILTGGLLQTAVALPLRAQAELTGPAVGSGARAHATRLAVGLTVAVAVYQAFGIRFGYWLPVTVLFVLRPDRNETVIRVIERALGTIAGVALASVLVAACHLSDAATVVLLALLAAASYALYFASYALSTVLLTVVVALLVELGGGSPIGALGDRLIDTAAGVAIALGAVALTGPRAGRTQRVRSRAAVSSVAAYGRRGEGAG